MDPSPILDILRQAVPGASLEPLGALDMPTIAVDRDHIVPVLEALRDHPALQFSFLCDLIGTDTWPVEPRFEIVYQLACLGEAFKTAGAATAAPPRRVRLKTRTSGDEARIPTATTVFPGANWAEREVFDLFGVEFEGHPDLTRLMMPEGWHGHPLRRDYPIGGEPVDFTITRETYGTGGGNELRG